MTDYPKAVADGWHPVATAKQVGAKPLARRLMGRPIVLFRSADGLAVLVDRCPHRNMPLSRGRVRGGQIECPYHGWRFGADGRCMATPGADEPATHGAQALPVMERAGLIWTTLARVPIAFPEPPHPVGCEGFDSFLWPVRPSRAALVDAVENLLDPAHPHFLHAGIVRSGDLRQPVEVTVKLSAGFAEAIYVENARASALMPRLLEGLRTTSIGRFFPPTIGQIAFEGPSGLRLAITVFFTPEDATTNRPFAHFATPKGRAPAFLKEALLRVFHIPVLAQDRAALRAQTDNIETFGGPRYAQGPLDFLRPAIQALANGEALETRKTVTRVRL
jgi:phenylpropionate dioxygenase-like ring-hydroxylating dioxygenase large terminal subunit